MQCWGAPCSYILYRCCLIVTVLPVSFFFSSKSLSAQGISGGENFPEGSAERAKLGRRASFGDISYTFSCQILKVQGQSFPSLMIFWSQISPPKAFCFR